MDTPSVNIKEKIENFFPANSNTGIEGVAGLTQRGPLGRPDILITSWPQFQLLYGNEITQSDFPSACRRALDRGAALRVCSVDNRADVTDATTTTKTASTPLSIKVYTLSTAMTAGKTLNFNPDSYIPGYNISLDFTSTGLDTMNAFAARIKSVYSNFVKEVIVKSSTVLNIIPLPDADTSAWIVLATGGGAPTVGAATAILGSTLTGGTAETRGTVDINIASIGVDGNVFTVAINGVTIASYTKIAGDSTATLVAVAIRAAINAATGTTGFTAAGATSHVIISTPVGSGVNYNNSLASISYVSAAWTASITGAVAASGISIFTGAPKYLGISSNMIVEIKDASNGLANYFDMELSYYDLPNYKEPYKNLQATPTTVPNSHYLDNVNVNGIIGQFTYTDQSASGIIPRPSNGRFYFTGGSVGNALTDADRIGTIANKTGIYAFNGIADMLDLSFLTHTGTSAALALEAYVQNRGDMCAIFHLQNTTTIASNLIAERQTLALSTRFAIIFAGGLVIADNLQPNVTPTPERSVTELGDVLGASATSGKLGAWLSPSGVNRGLINNALRVLNNQWMDSAQQLADNQINFVTAQDGKKYLWQSFTAQTGETNAFSFWNVSRMINELKKTLAPILKKYIEEPCDFPTFKLIYLNVKPTLEERKTQRAIFDYAWQGDQDATTFDNLVINNEADIRAGKYKVTLRIKEIVSLQTIDLTITLSPSGVSFEDALSQTGL